MKRWQTVFLVLIIISSLLTSCSDTSGGKSSDDGNNPNHAAHIVAIDKVIDALQNPDAWVVIDARTAEEFNGESRLPNAFGVGRLKGAVNVDKNLAFDSDGERLTKDELVKLYEFIGGKKVIVYCHGGARSKDIWEILANLGFDVWHYDGSWIDWSRAASVAEGSSDDVVLGLTEKWTDNEGVIEVP